MVKRLLTLVALLLLTIPVMAQDDTSETTDDTMSDPVINRNAPDPDSVTTEEILSGMAGALFVTTADDGTNRLFVVKQAGEIVVHDSQTDSEPQIFMDVNPLLTNDVNTPGYTERGLLGLAFHPDYEENGEFFINYTDRRGDTIVARYTVSEDDPNRANMDSAEILMNIPQPFPNHNGGHMAFGPDGYLYIATGDGGSANDPQENAQDTSNLLGKILRIDINTEQGYVIPEDNPFVDGADGQPEIWSYGLRNPWRFSFDRATGDMFMGDVGQNQWEEVNFEPADSPGGLNYGWDAYEGTHRFEQEQIDDPVMPFAEYNHSFGCSVTGGYIYRGEAMPDLHGVYFYSDFCSGNVWAAYRDMNGDWQSDIIMETGQQISSFGEDENGELYLVGYRGSIMKLVPAQ
jgi:glucose/arabinose dehydrogenase